LTVGPQRRVHLDIRQDIVPLSGNLIFGQDEAFGFHARSSLVVRITRCHSRQKQPGAAGKTANTITEVGFTLQSAFLSIEMP
jgi:hypothetical protein